MSILFFWDLTKQLTFIIFSSTSNILAIAQNIITAYRQQLQETKQNYTVIMNCLTGSERSGIMALAIAAILASQSRRPILISKFFLPIFKFCLLYLN